MILCIVLIGQSFTSELTNPFSSIFANAFSYFELAHNFVSVLSHPLTLVFATPLAGYIFLRSEIDKIEFSQIKKILCYGVVILLVSSAVITPYSFSPYAFASIDSTNSTSTDSTNSTSTDSTNSTSIYTTQTVSSVNGTSSPTQEPDETIPCGETLTSLSTSTDSTNSTSIYTTQTVSSVNGTSSPTQEPDETSPSGETLTSSLTLDGDNDYVETTATNATTYISEMAISAWVKPDYSSGSPEFTVVSKGESFVLSINNNIPPEKIAKFSVFDGIRWTTVQSNSTIPEEWTHLTASFNKTGIKIYINGVLEGTSLLEGVFQVSANGQIESKTVDEITSFNDVIIGASLTSDSESTPYNMFSGLIEGVQFYDIEQNPIEISQIYKFALNLQQLDSESLELSDVTVDEFTLEHDSIIIGQTVIWTEQISLTDWTDTLVIELSDDADVTLIEITNADFTTTTFDTTEIEYSDKIIETSSYEDIPTNSSLASLDLVPEQVQEEEPTKLLVINETTSDVLIEFETSAPYTIEKEYSNETMYNKTVTVASFSTLHYTNVTSYSDIPEELVEQGVEFDLFWNIDGVKTNVTDDPLFQVEFVDSDGNGIVDQIWWVVPQLSEQQFEIIANIIIINVQSYPSVGGEWTVRFNTTGTADLTITGFDGTTFGSSAPDDLEFLELNNGTHTLTPIIQANSILYQNYSSSLEGFETSRVLTAGQHHLEFRFGNSVDYAHNLATNISPVANDDSVTTTIDTPLLNINVLANDTDANSDTLIISSVSDPPNGVAATNSTSTGINYSPDSGVSGTDTFTYAIDDGFGGTDTATVTVTILNTPPVAGIFAPTNVVEQALVPLDGSPSSDVDNQELTFLWTQFEGPQISISGFTTSNATFTAPTVTTQQVLLFNLKVTDTFGAEDNEIISITVHKRPPPVRSQTLFGIDATEANLITIDTSNGTATSSLPMNAPTAITALAIDPTTAQMYAGGGGGIPFVYMVNHKTGLATFIGDSGLGFASIEGMEFKSDGTLLASVNIASSETNDADHLASIDTITGLATIIGTGYGNCEPSTISLPSDGSGSCVIEGIDGMAFDENSIFFAARSSGATNNKGLYNINFNTGKLSNFEGKFVNSSGRSIPSGGIVSLQFVNNTLFGGTAALPGNDDGGVLVTIDPTTAIFTSVGHTTSTNGNLSSLAFTATSKVDLSITKTVDKPSVTFGDTITFSITLGNIGPDDGTNIVVQDTLPSGFNFASSQSTLGSYNNTSGNWTIATLDTDSSAILNITGTATSNITNTAEVISVDQDDPDSVPNDGISSQDDQDSISVSVDQTQGSFESPTGTGTITSSISSGGLTALAGVSESTLPTQGRPPNVDFPHGFISWTVSGLSPGETIDMTITYPTAIPTGAQYWNVVNGVWTDSTSLLFSDNGDNVFVLTITDGGFGDADGIANGEISVLGAVGEGTGPLLGPEIVSITAGDPDGTITGEASGFTDGDTITVTFSEETNRPVVSKADIDNLLNFTENSSPVSLGTDYVGTWVSATTLIITIIDTGSANPQIGVFKIGVIGELKNIDETSLASTDISDPLEGDFGTRAGPSIISITAADLNVSVVSGFSAGDAITVRFSEETNEPFRVQTGNQLSKIELDLIFKYLQGGGELPSLAGNYSGTWLNALTLRITIDDANIATPPAINQLRLEVRFGADLQAADGSPRSTSISPPLTGTFGVKAGPFITSLVANDPDGADAFFSAGDTITVTFSEDTNTPSVATKIDIDNLFTFSLTSFQLDSTADYTGVFVDPVTLVITIVEKGSCTPNVNCPAVGEFTVTLLASGNLKNTAGTSLASTATSPLLTGNFGEKPGPSIELVEAADPNDPVVAGFSDGDTITITFSEKTNRPSVSTKTNLDTLFTFSTSIGDNYVGTWASPSVLIITILDTGAVSSLTALTITVKQTGGLTNEAGTSLASAFTFNAAFTDTEFGQKQGPFITSIKAADPEPIDDAVFGNGDTITARFSEATNEPFRVQTANQLSKADLDDLFIFSQSIGDDYSGKWLNALTLLITIEDAINLEAPPQIGKLTLQVKDDVVELRDEANSSEISTSVSPPLTGTFGNKAGPSITSLVALDPFANTKDRFGDGDTITVTFSEPTNEPDPTPNVPGLSKDDLDVLFKYLQGGAELESLGGDYRGEYIDPLILDITFTTSTGSIVSEAASISDLRFEVQSEGDLRDANNTSLVSVSPSPPLEGTFTAREGPSILSIKASDSPVTPASGFSNGDTITVKFSEATNKPAVETQASLDTLFTFSPSLDAVFTGKFIDPETLILTTIDSGTVAPQVGVFTLKLNLNADLRSGTGTSAASISESPALVGDFGLKAGPTIQAIIADDSLPVDDTVFGNGDTITIKFLEPTNTPPVETKADIDKLFIFSQNIGDDYTGVFTLNSTLVIIVTDTANLEVPPAIGELTITVKASGNLRDFAGTSLPSTSVSPPLAGSFGNFVEVIPLTNGGTAFTTLPTGITAEITLPEGQSGIITIEKTDINATLSDTGIVVDFLGNVMEITPSEGADCTVGDGCQISFTFSGEDAAATGTIPSDVKILHDEDNSGTFESDEILDGQDGRQDTTIAEIILDLLFEASSVIDDNSKFAVGGVKALALGVFAGSLGGVGSNVPGFGETSFTGMGSGAGGFGVILELDLSDPNAVTKLHPEDRVIMRQDLYENQGINYIQHVALYFGKMNTPAQLITSKTYILFEKGLPLQISDPNGYFTNKTKFDILERDAYNFVLKYDIEFANTMTKSDALLYMWDGDRNVVSKEFENLLVVLPTNPKVPEWVKNTAKWWTENQISDTEFVQAIEFLAKQEIIDIPPTKQTEDAAQSVPDWIKNTAEWWSDDLITEDDFIAAIQWLATNGIIII